VFPLDCSETSVVDTRSKTSGQLELFGRLQTYFLHKNMIEASRKNNMQIAAAS